MKIQIASDLHLEHVHMKFPRELFVRPVAGVDVLVLAGDIHSGAAMINHFRDFPVPNIVTCLGNHESYGYSWDQLREEFAKKSAGTKIHLLDNDEVVIDGVRFLGCTLWTDFNIDGTSQLAAMGRVGSALMDFKLIKKNKGTAAFSARDSYEEHLKSRAWLQSKLAQPFEGKTVFVSHHGLHHKSIHPQYRKSDLNSGFVSDMSQDLKGVDLAIHGHIHNTRRYKLEGGAEVIANPRGYVLNLRTASSPNEFVYENAEFDPELVVEI